MPPDLAELLARAAVTAGLAARHELEASVAQALDGLPPDAPAAAVEGAARQAVLEHLGPLAWLLGDSSLAAWLAGAGQVARRLPGPLPPAAPAGAAGAPSLPHWDWDGSPAYLPLIDRAVRDLQARRLVTRQQWDALSAQVRQQAFTVAGRLGERAIGQVRDAVAEAVERGQSFPAFRQAVQERLGTGALGVGHLENVFRTNTAQALAGSQETLGRRPVVRELYPYRERVPIRDSRLTELCAHLARAGIQGTAIYRADDPVWQETRPPSHFQCRCGTKLLSREDAAERGVVAARRWLETGEDPRDFVPAPDVAPPEGWTPGGAVSLAQRHAPQGGITVHGRRYPGGEFLPAGPDESLGPGGGGEPPEPPIPDSGLPPDAGGAAWHGRRPVPEGQPPPRAPARPEGPPARLLGQMGRSDAIPAVVPGHERVLAKALRASGVRAGDLPSLAGAPDGAEVTLAAAVSGAGAARRYDIAVTVRHDFFGRHAARRDAHGEPVYDPEPRVVSEPCVRTLRLYARGKHGYVVNEGLFVDPTAAPPGFGRDVFVRQVENLLHHPKITHIRTHAAASNPADPWRNHTGYWYWPLLGFDQTLELLIAQGHEDVAEDMRGLYPDVRSILDLYEQPGGLRWWQANGCDLHSAEFDLRPGSRSLETLEAYLAGRRPGG